MMPKITLCYYINIWFKQNLMLYEFNNLSINIIISKFNLFMLFIFGVKKIIYKFIDKSIILSIISIASSLIKGFLRLIIILFISYNLSACIPSVIP